MCVYREKKKEYINICTHIDSSVFFSVKTWVFCHRGGPWPSRNPARPLRRQRDSYDEERREAKAPLTLKTKVTSQFGSPWPSRGSARPLRRQRNPDDEERREAKAPLTFSCFVLLFIYRRGMNQRRVAQHPVHRFPRLVSSGTLYHFYLFSMG